jgi:hypothetical protein
MTPPSKLNGTRRSAKVCRRTPLQRDHLRIMEPICSKLLFYQKERWKVMHYPGLPTNQQMNKEKSKHISFDPTNDQ